jgi:heptaprenyl diphosphate synthase
MGDAVNTVVPLDLAGPDVAAEVIDGLARVEAGLRQAARVQHPLLDETSVHLMEAGGKRFRATLVLLAAQFGNPKDERVVPAAVAIELTHLAPLYHDDVMDEASVRRGSPSANSRWGNSVAILTGDFLFACASKILADLGPQAVRIQAETFCKLVSGQIAETIGPRPGQDGLDHYMNVITEKTAALIATSGRFGAMSSGAPAGVEARIAPACAALGVAWQLSDDILDVTSESAQSGKTPGTDLREGIKTLPVLHRFARPARRTRACWNCWAAVISPTRASAPRRSGCCGRTRRCCRRRPTCGAGPTWPATRYSRCPRYPPGPRSRRSATS